MDMYFTLLDDSGSFPLKTLYTIKDLIWYFEGALNKSNINEVKYLDFLMMMPWAV